MTASVKSVQEAISSLRNDMTNPKWDFADSDNWEAMLSLLDRIEAYITRLPLKKYFVLYGNYDEYFVCEAESADHAGEQCHDFTGGKTIHGIWLGVQDDDWVQ